MFIDKVIAHKVMSINEYGRDFFVGDIHGHKQQLITQLTQLDFNYDHDRLFCVGDIIDRGTESEACLDLLTQPWFFSTLGNHEALFLQGFEQAKYWQILMQNGGQWIVKLLDKPQLLQKLAELIYTKMPLSYSVSCSSGLIGVIHAEAPADWSTLASLDVNKKNIEPLIWPRRNLITTSGVAIKNVKAVVHGHNAIESPAVINNQVWIDTFKKSGTFTILSASEVLLLAKH